jgi:redox-sensitive bicupin YhaK (pirin superfamily)
MNHESPVPVYSPLYLIEIKAKRYAKLVLGEELYGEAALYILNGKVKADGFEYEPKRILVAVDSKLCEFEMEEGTTVYIFGGEPFPEERFIYWNFVASNRELIEQAKQNWKAQTFPKIAGETEFVPLPEF